MIQSRHATVLKDKIARRRVELTQALVAGVTRKTYWRLIGQLQGLEDAERLSDDADVDMSGG